MNNKLFIGLGVAAVIVIGIIAGVSYQKSQLTGGDFAGGIVPSNLWTANTSGGPTGSGYIQPTGGFAFAAPNGLAAGGNNQYHGFASYNSASGTPASAVTLGPFGATTSSATSSVTLPDTFGLSVGAICSGGAATTTVFVSGCLLTTTSGATGTATVAYSNITNAALSVPTSTVFRITFDQLPY